MVAWADQAASVWADYWHVDLDVFQILGCPFFAVLGLESLI